MCLCGYILAMEKSRCYQVLPFIMDCKHGVVEMERHSLVLVVIDRILICNRNVVSTQGIGGLLVSPLEARSNIIRFTRPTCTSQFCHYVIISTLINAHVQTVCTRPSSFPILEGLGMTFQYY